MKRVKEILSDTQRIRGQVPDSCLSCEFFNPLGRVRIHQVSMWGTLFSTSKDDSLDKKQIVNNYSDPKKWLSFEE